VNYNSVKGVCIGIGSRKVTGWATISPRISRCWTKKTLGEWCLVWPSSVGDLNRAAPDGGFSICVGLESGILCPVPSPLLPEPIRLARFPLQNRERLSITQTISDNLHPPPPPSPHIFRTWQSSENQLIQIDISLLPTPPLLGMSYRIKRTER